MSTTDEFISEIEALSRRLMAGASDHSDLAAQAQQEANRFQEIANIINGLGHHQSEAAQRLAELSVGDSFQLPQMFYQSNNPQVVRN